MRFTHAQATKTLQSQFAASGYKLTDVTPAGFHAVHPGRQVHFRVFTPDTSLPTHNWDEILAGAKAAAEADPAVRVAVVSAPVGGARLADGVAVQTAFKSLSEMEPFAGRVFLRTFGQVYRDAFQQGGGSVGIELELGEGRGSAAKEQFSRYFSLQDDEPGTFHPDRISYNIHQRRVDQPYAVLSVTNGFQRQGRGEDLFRLLSEELTALKDTDAPNIAQVDFVAGRAAHGKSVLFASLIRKQHEILRSTGFLQPYPHPLYAFPQRLIVAERDVAAQTGDRLNALFEAIARTEADGVLTTPMLEWMVREGVGSLMLDGLDEFFYEQTGFLDALNERLLVPGSRARITVFLRENLFATSEALKAFVAGLEASGRARVRIFEVLPWSGADGRIDPAILRQFIWLHREGRHPSGDEPDTEDIAAFIRTVLNSNTLATLAATPFFLRLMADFDQDTDRPEALPKRLDHATDLDLLEYAVRKIIEREWDKILQGDVHAGEVPPVIDAFAALDPSIWKALEGSSIWFQKSLLGRALASFSGSAFDARSTQDLWLEAKKSEAAKEDFRLLLENLAFAARRGGNPGGDGLTVQQVDKLYRSQALPLSSAGGTNRAGLVLQRFALFGRGGDGQIEFTHEIIADYLAGKSAVRQIKRRPRHIGDAIGAPPPDDTGYFNKTILSELKSHKSLPDVTRTLAGA